MKLMILVIVLVVVFLILSNVIINNLLIDLLFMDIVFFKIFGVVFCIMLIVKYIENYRLKFFYFENSIVY